VQLVILDAHARKKAEHAQSPGGFAGKGLPVYAVPRFLLSRTCLTFDDSKKLGWRLAWQLLLQLLFSQNVLPLKLLADQQILLLSHMSLNKRWCIAATAAQW